MWALIAAAGGLSTVIGLVVWAFKAYTATKNAEAITAERQAGSDHSQVEAINAEINRVNRAADAGGKLPIDTPDSYDRDGK